MDDEPSNRQFLAVMLASEGYLLQEAESGEQALGMIATHPPDLILLDLMMPGMDGHELASLLKSNFATRNIPIIVVTALDDRDAQMRSLTAGAEDFLNQPVDRAELYVRVRNLLRLKAYGDYHDRYSQLLEDEVVSRTADVRRERDRAQRYLDTAEVVLVALDPERRVTLANRFTCNLLGWVEEELVGRDWFQYCLAPASRGPARQKFAALLESDRSTSENAVVTRGGAERRIEWHSTVLKNQAQRVTGVISSGTDITERHAAVEALRTAEERTRFALQSANVGIWDHDFTTGVIRWSEIMEAHHGLQPGTFGGTVDAFVECIHPEDREAVGEAVGEAMKTGDDFVVNYRAFRPDGSMRWLSGGGRILLDGKRRPLRGLGISQDVTERHTLEAQFQQAQKMEAVGRLASGVAHDFNNLLTVILGCAQLVADDPAVRSPHEEDLAEIVKTAHRGKGLTRQLIAFSRQQVLQAAPLDVNGLITDMAGMLERLIGRRVRIALSLAPGLAPAFVDRSQLEQVVMNLVVNARDAMVDGGVVTVETADVDLDEFLLHGETVTAGPYIMLAITDTGSGMSRETQQRLFEPFFTTKEVGEGTGLGLSTTYGIVRQSKGHIVVSSGAGRGTTFKVYLPRSS